MLPRWATRAGLPMALAMVVITWFGVAPLSFTLFGYGWPFVAVIMIRRRRKA